MTVAAKLMSVDDVCDYLGVSRYFVYDQVRLGTLPCARIARQLRFRPDDIDEFVQRRFIADTGAIPDLARIGSARRMREA